MSNDLNLEFQSITDDHGVQKKIIKSGKGENPKNDHEVEGKLVI